TPGLVLTPLRPLPVTGAPTGRVARGLRTCRRVSTAPRGRAPRGTARAGHPPPGNSPSGNSPSGNSPSGSPARAVDPAVVAANVASVRERVAAAAARAGRDPAEVGLVAVAKLFPPEAVRAVVAARGGHLCA